jgi:N-acetylglucosamine-6-phosphate deacetylase
MKRAITGAALIASDRLIPSGTVVINDGVIAEVVPHPGRSVMADSTLDASGLTLAPGFIDLQINGGFGLDLASDPRSIWALGARLVELGVTSFLPTIISSPRAVVKDALAVLGDGPPPDYKGSVALGLHLEGPFLSPSKRGAHPLECLRRPATEEVRGWSLSEGVAMVTIAPELPAALEVISQLITQGVIVGAGHSGADFKTGTSAIDAGVTYGTHLFNAMTGLDHRAPGLAAALLANPRATLGVIADGIHVHPEMVRIAWRLAGPDRFSLVSDAMAGLGMPLGTFQLGLQKVTVSDSGARLADGTLAGSVLRLDQAVRNLTTFTGCPPELAVRSVTSVPARLLGRADLGSIRPQARADLVLLTPEMNVVATLIAGEIVYTSEDAPSWD